MTKDENRYTMWIWLACLGLGIAFTTIATQLAAYITTGQFKHVIDNNHNSNSHVE